MSRRTKLTIFNVHYAWKYDCNAIPGAYLGSSVPEFETAVLHGATKEYIQNEMFYVNSLHMRILKILKDKLWS